MSPVSRGRRGKKQKKAQKSRQRSARGGIEDWLSRPAAWIPVPGSRHQQVLGGIVRECRTAGNLVPDAHLAALALEHGLTVVSTDTDFARFPGLAWLNPVSAATS